MKLMSTGYVLVLVIRMRGCSRFTTPDVIARPVSSSRVGRGWNSSSSPSSSEYRGLCHRLMKYFSQGPIVTEVAATDCDHQGLKDWGLSGLGDKAATSVSESASVMLAMLTKVLGLSG